MARRKFSKLIRASISGVLKSILQRGACFKVQIQKVLVEEDDNSDADERNNDEGSDDEGYGVNRLYQVMVMHPTYIYSSRTPRITDWPHRLSTFALTDVRKCVLGDGV